MQESSSVAAIPPWTEPIGLYIHSAGWTANTARPCLDLYEGHAEQLGDRRVAAASRR